MHIDSAHQSVKSVTVNVFLVFRTLLNCLKCINLRGLL